MSNKNKEPNEYRAALSTLKKALKERGLTYRDLGKGIGLSESGIKKIFTAKDGSFQRIVEICQFIGISLVEVIADNQVTEVTYNQKQQTAFLKEPTLFYLYWLLVYERQSLQKAQKTLALKKDDAFRLTRKLDLLNLIKLLPRDRLRLPSIKAVNWKKEGEFVQKIYKQWSNHLVDSVVRSDKTTDQIFLLRYLQMKKNTYKDFMAAIKSLEEEFIRRSIYEMRTSPHELEHVRWLVAADNQSFVSTQKTITSIPEP